MLENERASFQKQDNKVHYLGTFLILSETIQWTFMV